MTKDKSAYAASGVSIAAQDESLAQVKKLARSTFTPGVLSELGLFGGLFRPELAGFQEPVLVASADGVGTKLAVAKMAGDFSTVGRDLVNHCVNDILVQGALPLFFLDYVGAGVLAAGCKENGCALLGGETAEMPGFYQAGDYELVGFIVGLVDRPRILDGTRVRPGDVLVGLPSAGLHTNGYSLARKILFETMGLKLQDRLPGGGSRQTVGEWLLAPHLSYLAPLRPLLGHPALHALAHITGGGLTDNLPRILPAETHASIKPGSWEIPEIYEVLRERGEVEIEEMFRVFNMGIGMVLVVQPDGLREILAALRTAGQSSHLIGTVQAGGEGVVYDFGMLDGE
jgi:phosphoribosylformylglycinamidine cyclo-ligase